MYACLLVCVKYVGEGLYPSSLKVSSSSTTTTIISVQAKPQNVYKEKIKDEWKYLFRVVLVVENLSSEGLLHLDRVCLNYGKLTLNTYQVHKPDVYRIIKDFSL